MKPYKFKITALGVATIMLASCADLDIQPLSTGTSDNWFRDETEISMSINDLWQPSFFPIDDDDWSDDMLNRDGSNEFTVGTVTSQSSTCSSRWATEYKAISRSFKILESLNSLKGSGISEEKLKQYEGDCYFMLGFAYGELATYFGDCVLMKSVTSLDDAYKATRSPKAEVMEYAYECFDKAAEMLPKSYSGTQTPTQGAALGFKARFALCAGDYQIAADAAKACMNLGVYSLHPNYRQLFQADKSNELIFYFKGFHDQKYGVSKYFSNVKQYIIRQIGGFSNHSPSLELFCSYTCTDGLPIDKSPLYNPKDPFANRDPRCAYTIQPFKTKYSPDIAEYEKSKADGTFAEKYPDYITLGYEYNPSPYSTKVYEAASKSMVTTKDSKGANQHSAYNGLLLRKYVKDDWADWGLYAQTADNCFPYLRYAEILLTYAEAMNELGKCNQQVLDESINLVRERAYNGTGIEYPRVLADSQANLRKTIRMERRSEFAFEGMRYRDLIRWKIADKAYNKSMYYLNRAWSGSASWNGKTGSESNVKLPDGFTTLLKNWDDGNYPIGGIPTIDENGLPDLSSMEKAGYIVTFYKMGFEAPKNYLWPIPANDILVNPALTQNTGY